MYIFTNQRRRVASREAIQYKYIDLACLVIHAVWMVLFFYEGIFLLGILNTVSCSVYVYLYDTINRGLITRTIVIFYIEVLCHSVAALLCLGFTGGFDLYILIFIPVMFFYSLVYAGGHRVLTFGGVIAGIVYIVLKIITYFSEPIYVFTDPTVEFGIMVFNCGMCIFNLLMMTYLSCKEITQNRKELEEKNKELTFLSCHDPLTKLLNRRSMEEIIDRLQENASENCAVAFFDIDNFKNFNDKYGHECGDIVLVKVAEIIGADIDSPKNLASHYSCRWGGEEMIILFHDWEKDQIIKRVTQIKDEVERISLCYNDGAVSVSVTCGLTFSQKKVELHKMINVADSYMLEGKRKGKNCIIYGQYT